MFALQVREESPLSLCRASDVVVTLMGIAATLHRRLRATPSKAPPPPIPPAPASPARGTSGRPLLPPWIAQQPGLFVAGLVVALVAAHSVLHPDAYGWRLYVQFVAWFPTGRVPVLGVAVNEFTNSLLGA